MKVKRGGEKKGEKSTECTVEMVQKLYHLV